MGLEIFVGPDKLPQVVETLPKKGGPAYEAGVRLNDKILQVGRHGASSGDPVVLVESAPFPKP